MIIKTENLVKAYKGKRVVNDVSIEVPSGRVTGLLGPNGAGKTTTFYMVVGLVRPNEGRVLFDDQEITRLPMYKRSRLGIGYLAQEASIFRRLTVRQNIELVMQMNGYSPAKIKDTTHQLAEELHLSHFLDKPGQVLSGGERRRAEIARSLSTEPKFLLLDEPFTGIDPVTIEELQQIIRNLCNKGIGILITDHNVDATLSITDYNYILVSSQVIATGKEDEIRANEQVRQFYLGEGYRRTEITSQRGAE